MGTNQTAIFVAVLLVILTQASAHQRHTHTSAGNLPQSSGDEKIYGMQERNKLGETPITLEKGLQSNKNMKTHRGEPFKMRHRYGKPFGPKGWIRPNLWNTYIFPLDSEEPDDEIPHNSDSYRFHQVHHIMKDSKHFPDWSKKSYKTLPKMVSWKLKKVPKSQLLNSVHDVSPEDNSLEESSRATILPSKLLSESIELHTQISTQSTTITPSVTSTTLSTISVGNSATEVQMIRPEIGAPKDETELHITITPPSKLIDDDDSVSEEDNAPPELGVYKGKEESEETETPPSLTVPTPVGVTDENSVSEEDSLSEEEPVSEEESDSEEDSLSEEESVSEEESDSEEDSLSEEEPVSEEESDSEEDSLSEEESVSEEDSTSEEDSESQEERVPPETGVLEETETVTVTPPLVTEEISPAEVLKGKKDSEETEPPPNITITPSSKLINDDDSISEEDKIPPETVVFKGKEESEETDTPPNVTDAPPSTVTEDDSASEVHTIRPEIGVPEGKEESHETDLHKTNTPPSKLKDDDTVSEKDNVPPEMVVYKGKEEPEETETAPSVTVKLPSRITEEISSTEVQELIAGNSASKVQETTPETLTPRGKEESENTETAPIATVTPPSSITDDDSVTEEDKVPSKMYKEEKETTETETTLGVTVTSPTRVTEEISPTEVLKVEETTEREPTTLVTITPPSTVIVGNSASEVQIIPPETGAPKGKEQSEEAAPSATVTPPARITFDGSARAVQIPPKHASPKGRKEKEPPPRVTTTPPSAVNADISPSKVQKIPPESGSPKGKKAMEPPPRKKITRPSTAEIQKKKIRPKVKEDPKKKSQPTTKLVSEKEKKKKIPKLKEKSEESEETEPRKKITRPCTALICDLVSEVQKKKKKIRKKLKEESEEEPPPRKKITRPSKLIVDSESEEDNVLPKFGGFMRSFATGNQSSEGGTIRKNNADKSEGHMEPKLVGKPELSISKVTKISFKDVLPKFKMYRDKLQTLISRLIPLCPEVHGIGLLRAWVRMFRETFPNFVDLSTQSQRFAEDLKSQLSRCYQRVRNTNFFQEGGKTKGEDNEDGEQKLTKRSDTMDVGVSGRSFQSDIADPLISFFSDFPNMMETAIEESK